MKKWLTVSLTLIAFGALAVALSRWWLPLLGLAGAGNEMIRPLDSFWPWLVWILIAVLALLIVNLRWDRLFRRSKTRRLVDEAEEWSEDFRIGSDLPLELANQDGGTESVLPRSKVRLFAEQLEPVERQQSLPIAASTAPSAPPAAPEPLAEAPSSPASSDAAAPLAELPGAAPVSFKQRSERVTIAFADEPEAEVVELPATRELIPVSTLAEEDVVADRITPSDVAHAATVAQSEQLPASAFQLPPIPEAFTGRVEELTALKAALSDSTCVGLSIQGAGGVGKTALALALAQQLAPQYPDAQLFLDLQGVSLRPLTTVEAQQHVLRIGQTGAAPGARLPENETALSQAYQAALADKRILLFFDNVADAAQIGPLLPPPGCLLIFTTRQSFSLSGVFTLPLDPLSAAEAEQWLTRLLPRVGEHAAAIARQCEYLPLALRLAASALTQRPELTAASYSWKLAQVAQRLSSSPAHPPYEPALTLSYELLSSGLQKLWRTLAVFPDTFDVTGAAAVWTLHPERALRALRRLMEFELVEGQPATGRYRLHDLKRAFANTLLRDAERRVCLQNHAEYYQSVLHEADALYEQGGAALKRGLGLVDRDWHNIEAGQLWAAVNAETDQAACELCSSYPDAGRYVLDLRQSARERLRWCEAALDAAIRLNRRKAESRHLLALGKASLHLNELDWARGYYERALEITREQADPGGEARALNGLGFVAAAGAAYEPARTWHTQALDLARARGDQRNEAQALGGRGVVHAALLEWPEAQAFFQQQLTLTRAINDQRGEASAMTQLGLTSLGLQQLKAAFDWLEKALVLVRDLSDRRGEASVLDGLGVASLASGDKPRATGYWSESLRLASLSEDQRLVASVRSKLRETPLPEA